MTKNEIYEKILAIAALVCCVDPEDIRSGSRKFDVVTARSIAVFWLNAAGFSVESLLACSGKEGHNTFDSIKDKIEEYWTDRFAYHMLTIEVGRRLLDFAHSIGEDFDMWKPINRIAEITGKYAPYRAAK